MKTWCCVALMFSLGSSACGGTGPVALNRLHPCAPREGPVDSYCGTLEVLENPEARAGRTLHLKIIVAPALRRDPQPDPLFVFAGGPGAGAASLASSRLPWFRRVQVERDIVFIDQRGTGESNPLDCPTNEDGPTLSDLVEYPLDRFHTCLQEVEAKANPRLYTTALAVDDVDAVRRYLGYDQINLWGASYGSRAALVYLTRHEASVRSAVLDSVNPPDAKRPLYWPRDGQRALDRLITDCANDGLCNSRFPDLGRTVEVALARADARPLVHLQHPRSGLLIEGRISRELVAGIVYQALYTTSTAALLPELLSDAAAGDFQGLLGLALQSGALPKGMMSEGLFLSVVCSEDATRYTRADIVRAAAGTFLGTAAYDTVFKPCIFWPTGKVDPQFYEPVHSAKPVLVLSGAEDPDAPPPWGEYVVKGLTKARHLVVPATGHVTSFRGCVPELIREFIESADSDALDTTCLRRLHRPPFFTSRAGTDNP